MLRFVLTAVVHGGSALLTPFFVLMICPWSRLAIFIFRNLILYSDRGNDFELMTTGTIFTHDGTSFHN
jgi:hypothetical protein